MCHINGEPTSIRLLAEKVQGLPPHEAMIEFDRWFTAKQAEMENRHKERMKEIRRLQRWSFLFIAFALVFLCIQIALRIWPNWPGAMTP